MRARYCAYAVADTDYLVATTHPDGPLFRADAKPWAAELAEYCRQTTFTKLTIHGDGPLDDGDAFVTFTAEFLQSGVVSEFTERSRFRRDGRRWKYYDGEAVPRPG